MTTPLPTSEQIIASAFKILAENPEFKIGTATIRGNDYRVFENAPDSLAEIFEKGAARGDKPFLHYEGETWTYAELWSEANRLAAALSRRLGVARGDRVAIAMRNYPEWITSYMALILIGAVVVPLNAWWKSEELRFALKDCGARIVILDAKRLAYLASEKGALGLTLVLARDEADGADFSYAQLLTEGAAGLFQKPPGAADDDFAIYYTSGSTGRPKGVVLTHRSALTTLYSWRLIMESITAANGGVALHGADPGVVLGIPLFHVTGSHAIFMLSWMIGRRVAMMPRWDAKAAVDLINRLKLTTFTGVPSQSYELMEAAGLTAMPTLVDLGAGGAKRPAEHVERLKLKFPEANPSSGYGLTETNAAGCVISLNDYRARPGAAGRALPPCCDIRIVGEQGDCAPGATGEIWIRSASNFRGYLNLPEETARAVTPDGWFRTGDLGTIDEEGFVTIVDRLKDLIIRGGENISCLEVEERAYRHKAVDQAIAFSVPDEVLGERVGLVVRPKPGAKIDPKALCDFMAESLAAFKCPERIWISPAPLPKLGTEKFDKQTIRRVALQNAPDWSGGR